MESLEAELAPTPGAKNPTPGPNTNKKPKRTELFEVQSFFIAYIEGTCQIGKFLGSGLPDWQVFVVGLARLASFVVGLARLASFWSRTCQIGKIALSKLPNWQVFVVGLARLARFE